MTTEMMELLIWGMLGVGFVAALCMGVQFARMARRKASDEPPF